jgi:hypothetical protein
MSNLRRLLHENTGSLGKQDESPKTIGEMVAEVTDNANLVEGKQTWEHADEKKDDIEVMKQCCAAELKTMQIVGLVAAPYYFERVAILSRKLKDYVQELHYCETYIYAIEKFYSTLNTSKITDVRKGPRYQSIVKRRSKAMQLLNQSKPPG